MKWLKRWKTQTLLLLAVIGPGFITANVDNDAGGIYTYSFAGAQFGTPLFTIPMTLALIVIPGDVGPHGRHHRQGPERSHP
jgi:Mn2+/Fe2+ NRAMP family transporter